MAQGCDLWQMGDAEHLAVGGHLLHDLRHSLSHCARNACVNFIENDSRQIFVTRDEGFESKHKAGDFASRGDLAHVLRRHLVVAAEKEGHAGCARGLGVGTIGEGERQGGRGHSQRGQCCAQLPSDIFASCLAGICECLSCCEKCLIMLRGLPFQFLDEFIAVFNLVERRLQFRFLVQQFRHGGNGKLLFETVDSAQAVVDELQACGVEL